MTAPKTKFPIESFGPQLMDALVGGGRGRVTILFEGKDGKRMAHNFQRRVHTLRSRMREENHRDYVIAARAKVSIYWGEKAAEQDPRCKLWVDDHNGHRGALIIIAPRDSEFEDVLRASGIGSAPTPVSTAHEHPPRDDLDELLDDLQKGVTST